MQANIDIETMPVVQTRSGRSRLKDEFGGRSLRVRGHAGAFYHLRFGVLALTDSQLMRTQI